MIRLLKKIGIPFVSLLGATLLWFYATLNRRYEEIIELPIKVIHIDSSLLPVKPIPEMARVLVSGTGRQLIAIRMKGTHLLVSAAHASKGTNILRLTPDNIELSGSTGVKSLSVKEPSYLELELDATVSKKIRVFPDIRMSLKQNSALAGKPVCDPPFVEINGPRSSISSIDSLYTRHVEIKNIASDTIVEIAVRKPDMESITIKPAVIKVCISAGEIVKREISSIPIRLIDVPDGVLAVLDIHTASLRVSGLKDEVDALRPEQINIFVPFKKFMLEGSSEIEPSVSIVGNLQWSNLNPKTVKLIKNDNFGN